MRNPWRLILLRNVTATRSSSFNSSSVLLEPLHHHHHHQVRKLDPQNPRYLSSFIIINRNTHTRNTSFTFDSNTRDLKFRFFSSESDVETTKEEEPDRDVLSEVFSRSNSLVEIKNELESLNVIVSHEMVLTSLRNLQGSPEVAWRLFDWVSKNASERLSSKSYNWMVGILGRKGHVKDFWNLVEVMKKKGYGVHRGTYNKVSESFKKDGMTSDLSRLEKLFDTKPVEEDPTASMCSKVCKVMREKEWDEGVKKELGEMSISWSSGLVEMVLEHLSVHPMKALMFFWWIEEGPSFKHTKRTYNAMAKVLAREDSAEKFWRVVDEMKSAGYAMEKETYITVMDRFYKRRMIKDAVDLYELMMGSPNTPSDLEALFLLRKIVVAKDLDMDLFSRVIQIYTGNGNSLTKSFLDGVLKSLRSVSKLQECGKVLKAFEKGGFVADNAVYSEIIYQLSGIGKHDEAHDILSQMEVSHCKPDFKTWASLIEGQCEARNIDAAASYFRKMVESIGVTKAGYSFELVVKGFCQKRRSVDACKFLTEMVKGKQLQPWHTTYKLLIQKLLVRGNLKEALSLIGLMKDQGFPPFLDPYIAYISKSGTGEDAMSFLTAVSVKKIPSTSVYIRMFEAFFNAGRHNEAHDCLSQCPPFIRNHADILNLFFDMKPTEVKPEEPVAATDDTVLAA